MSEPRQPDQDADARRTRRFRIAINAAIAVQVLLYLYLYVYIGRHANPMGDGMEWVAVMPATLFLGIGVAPALALSKGNRLLPIAVLLAMAGAMINVAYFLEIAREFAESAAR
jgi:hypothetical protein